MRQTIEQASIIQIEYLAVCDPQTLEPLATVTHRAVLLGAIRIGASFAPWSVASRWSTMSLACLTLAGGGAARFGWAEDDGSRVGGGGQCAVSGRVDVGGCRRMSADVAGCRRNNG